MQIMDRKDFTIPVAKVSSSFKHVPGKKEG